MLRLLLCLLLSLSLHGLCAGLLRESLVQAGETHSEALAQVVQLISLAPLAAPAPAASKPMLAALPPSLAPSPSPSPPALAPVKVRLAPKPLPEARQARRPNEPAPPAAAVASARSSAPAALSAGTVPAEVRAPVVAAAAATATAVVAEVLSHKPSFAQAPPAPRYPAQARRRNQQGVVLLEVRLDARGQQRALKLLRSSGVSSLDQAALAAVSQWRFRAEVRDGQSVPSRVQIPIEFALTATR